MQKNAGVNRLICLQHNEDNTFTEVSTPDKTKQLVYAGYTDNDEFKGVAIEAAGQGYADIIRVLYGYNPQTEKIIGFYVLESKETPGLGDKIEKDEGFLTNFNALDVSLDKSEIKNKVATVKHGAKTKAWEIDGITGATISSRAIGALLSTSTNNIIPVLYQNKNAFEIKNSETKK